MTPVTRVAIGLGSNLGDRAAHLNQAVEELRDLGEVVATSSIYETAPVGGPDQGPYLNAVVILESAAAPRRVLDRLRSIEMAHGRERRERWGPRTLDLDLLLYGAEVIDEPGLTVPHPRMTERRFVLEPLIEAWPDVALPDGRTASALIDAVADQAVDRWASPGRASLVVFLAVGLLAAAIWIGLDQLL